MDKYSIEKLLQIREKMQEVQQQYVFEIPGYVLDEIAWGEYDKTNLAMLINLAVINNRIDRKNALTLKKKYC